MCNSRNSTEIPYKNQLGYNAKVDKCLAEKIDILNDGGIKTLACCCGHGKYLMSILIEHKKVYRKKGVKTIRTTIFEYLSSKIINRKRRFYKKDKQGYYYIPETI